MRSTLLLTTILTLVGQQAAANIPSSEDAVAPAAAEGIEIMRRLLVEKIGSGLSKPRPRLEWSDQRALPLLDGSLRNMVQTSLRSGTAVTHSRGHLVPGSGAFFSLDVSIPVVPLAELMVSGESATEDGGSRSEWDRTRDLVRGRAPESQRQPLLETTKATELSLLYRLDASQQRGFELDGAAVDKVIDAALEIFVRHGDRLQGLEDDDGLVALIHLEPSASTRPLSLGSSADSTTWLANSLVSYNGARVRAEHLVIEISRSAARDVESAGQGAAEARSQAKISRY